MVEALRTYTDSNGKIVVVPISTICTFCAGCEDYNGTDTDPNCVSYFSDAQAEFANVGHCPGRYVDPDEI